MIRSRRKEFNQAWSPEKYARMLALLAKRFGEPAQFRLSETPCFLPASLVEGMGRCGAEMMAQLFSNREYMAASHDAIPPAYRVPREPAAPLFVQADFGLDENLHPQLVEIQGFPSLYAYQPALAEAHRVAYGLDAGLAAFPGGLGPDEYTALLRQAIVAEEDPATVVLLEIDPFHQKTRHDFAATEELLGVRAVDVRALRKEGRRLLYDRDGTWTPITRIYNRVIVDELERKRIALPFDYRDDLDVEWAGHPNWFFRLSKFSLPYLKHPAAPPTSFLNQAGAIDRPGEYVLKPLYSFAGLGVIVGPTREQLDAIPEARRGDYILQKRVDFQPVIETPHGPTKIEVRIMYIWLEPHAPRVVNTIIRMGRGAQMGVDHNKTLEWVGASAAFLESGA